MTPPTPPPAPRPKVPAQRTAPAGGFLAQPPRPARIAGYVLLLVLGALVGIAGALVQAAWPPGGLVLALAGLAGVGRAGSLALDNRAGGLVPGAGWLIVVILLTTTRPEGDYAFGAGLGSYVFLLGGMVVAVMCATLGRSSSPGGPAARLGK
ncbi:DUF6113 family protein [Streptomyces sp. NPDC007088]|uniref:DUF6113 family protein n=1 Tax=Streptomyces sp. NPDC007088 TaxID=3364773 RepID=UPI0036809351